MRTLYVRIVAIFIGITIVSSIIALLFANSYYSDRLKNYSEQEVFFIGQEIRDLYEEADHLQIDSYLTRIARMGFQIYMVNDEYEGQDIRRSLKKYAARLRSNSTGFKWRELSRHAGAAALA